MARLTHSLPPRIAFLALPATPDHQPHLSGVMQEIIAHLQAMGALVDFIVPEATALDIADIANARPAHDLYVLKSKSALALSLAGLLTRNGAQVVNTFWSSALTRDKIAATAVLAACGVPVPASWATGRTEPLRPLVQAGPIWIKPQRGSRGEGVQRIAEPSGLDTLEAPSDAHGLPLPLLAQREAPSDGQDLKMYVVGDRAWAITRPFPAQSLADKLGAPVAMSPRARAIATNAGRALGLELYGVDFMMSGDELCVVDVNAFPGYKGVPEAPRHIAGYLYQRALGRTHLQHAHEAHEGWERTDVR
jgi:ribosomal protein S6--L-glutamate ligase